MGRSPSRLNGFPEWLYAIPAAGGRMGDLQSAKEKALSGLAGIGKPEGVVGKNKGRLPGAGSVEFQ